MSLPNRWTLQVNLVLERKAVTRRFILIDPFLQFLSAICFVTSDLNVSPSEMSDAMQLFANAVLQMEFSKVPSGFETSDQNGKSAWAFGSEELLEYFTFKGGKEMLK